MFNKQKNKRKGFTLVELLVVIAIIGVLSAIAVPMYFRATEITRASEAMHVLGTLAKAQQRNKLQTQEYTDKISELDINLKPHTEATATDSKFDTQYFDFTLKSNYAQSERKTDEYTLYVAYDTNKITCADNGSGICQRLGLDEETEWSLPQFEQCVGTEPGDAWEEVFGISNYSSWNTSHSSYCKTRANNQTGNTEFNYCYDTVLNVSMYRIKIGPTSSSMMNGQVKCVEGYVSRDGQNGYMKSCKDADCTQWEARYFQKLSNGSIVVANCKHFNPDTDTCSDNYIDAYLVRTYQSPIYHTYCYEYDANHKCISCSGGSTYCNEIKDVPIHINLS